MPDNSRATKGGQMTRYRQKNALELSLRASFPNLVDNPLIQPHRAIIGVIDARWQWS
jgi:hypothetical protein